MAERHRSRSILGAETDPFSWKSPLPILERIFLESSVFPGEYGALIGKSQNVDSQTRVFCW